MESRGSARAWRRQNASVRRTPCRRFRRSALLRRGCTWCAALALCSALPVAACPPGRLLSVVVPYPAGGSLDVTTRVVADAAAHRLGRPVQVRNVPGASGLIGAREVANAAKDGCTILSGTVNTMVLIPLLEPHAGFRGSDFVPVSKIGS